MKFMNIKGPWLIIDRWVSPGILPIIIFLAQKSYSLFLGEDIDSTQINLLKGNRNKRLKNEKNT